MAVTGLHSPLVAKWLKIYPRALTLSWSSELFSFHSKELHLVSCWPGSTGQRKGHCLLGCFFTFPPWAGVEQSGLPHCAMCSPQDVSKHRTWWWDTGAGLNDTLYRCLKITPPSPRCRSSGWRWVNVETMAKQMAHSDSSQLPFLTTQPQTLSKHPLKCHQSRTHGPFPLRLWHWLPDKLEDWLGGNA